MPKAQLRMANIQDPYLQKTSVENLFLHEFLPTAPGEYVKVYLFGLMYAQNNMELDVAKLARIMKLSEADVLEAWGYWAKKGLLKLSHSNDNTEYQIEYVSLIENLYSKARKPETVAPMPQMKQESSGEIEDPVAKVVNMEIQAIFAKFENLTGKMLSAEDARKIGSAINTYNILPDIMSYAVDYCVEGERASVNQIIRTAVNWAKEGCTNLAEVKEYIDKNSKRNSYYNAVFREMGFSRLPNPPDREMMDRWFDELGYSIKEVLDACGKTAGLREPTLKYVNKILENQKLEQGGINPREEGVNPESAVVSKKVLKEYYDYIRGEAEKSQRARISKLSKEIPDLKELYELENKINIDLMTMTFGEGNSEYRQSLKAQRKQIENDRKTLLVENGYSEDYLDRKYRCDLCKDTGMTDDGRICSCSEARAQEALEWNKTRK